MPTVKEILHDKVTLDIRSVDRVLLNGWVKNLQMPGGVVNFILLLRPSFPSLTDAMYEPILILE